MKDFLDEQNIHDVSLELNTKNSFKFISIGLLIGLGIVSGSGSLSRIAELLGFQFNIFGLMNKLLAHILTILLTISLVVFSFKGLKMLFKRHEISVNRLFTNAIIFYVLMVVINAVIHLVEDQTENYYKNLEMNMEQLSQYTLYTTGLNLMGYLLIILGSVYFINAIGKEK